MYILRDIEGMKAFKIIQESLHSTRVLVVLDTPLDTPLDDKLKDHITRGVRARLGAQVEVTVERVEAIAPEASGKFRYVVSKVDAARNYGANHGAGTP